MVKLVKFKRIGVYILGGILPFLTFFLGLVFIGDVNIASVIAIVMAFLSAFLCNMVSSSPWVRAVEGDGIICLNIASTGIIEPYILKVENPYAVGKILGKVRKMFFDRAAINYLLDPKKGLMKESPNNPDKMIIEVENPFNKTDFNAKRFDLQGSTCFIYNEQLKNFITKDFLNEKEQGMFLKNQAMSVYLQLEDVKENLHYYASFVNQKLMKDKVFGVDMRLLALLLIVLIVAALFGPSIIDLINSVFSRASTSIGGATNSVGSGITVG